MLITRKDLVIIASGEKVTSLVHTHLQNRLKHYLMAATYISPSNPVWVHAKELDQHNYKIKHYKACTLTRYSFGAKPSADEQVMLSMSKH